MANTIITIKSSGVPGNVPSTLQPGELAINHFDGNLYYGNITNETTLFDIVTDPAGLDGEVQFNNSGEFGSSGSFTFNTLTEALTVARLNVDEETEISGNLTLGSFLEFSDGTKQFSSSESASLYANSAFDQANVSFTQANSAFEQANDSFIHANSAFENSNNKVSKNGDIMTGDYDITGNVDIVGDVNVTGNVKSVYLEVQTELFAGIATSQATLLPNVIAQFTSESETYTQVNQQNINANGSADFVVTADVGDDETFYVDLGYNGSQFNDPDNTVYHPLDSYLISKGSDIGQEGGNLIIGTITTTYDSHIKIIVGGANLENIIVTVDSDGLHVNGQITSETTNSIISLTNIVFDQANVADQKAVSAGSYANSSFDQANVADQKAVSAGNYANSAFAQANTAIVDASVADQKAVTSGVYANSAFNTSNIAFDFANTATINANVADQKAVSAGIYANSAFDQANTAIIDANVADQKAVTSGVYANSAFLVANTATTAASVADQKAVTSGVYANSAFLVANTAIVDANVADQKAVSAGSYANSAFVRANTAEEIAIVSGDYANSAFAQANTATTAASVADQKAVSAGSYANSSFDQANTATTDANVASNLANTAIVNANVADQKAVSAGNYANSAFAQANTATSNALSASSYANSAFNFANTRYSSSGGTIDGNVTITGNLNITGNVVSHGADELKINDPIILLANNNVGNTIDIGFTGHYSNDSGENIKHLGIVHHAATETFYFFYDYNPHLQDNNILDINDASFRLSNLTANLITDVAFVRGYDPINHANNAFDTANTKVSKSGDTMSGSLTGVTNLGVNSITLEQSLVTTNTFTTSSTSQVTIDLFPSSSFRSAKYYVQITSGTSYQVIELSLLHDGSDVNLVQYGEIRTGSSLGSFDSIISGSNLNLLFTPTNSITTVKFNRMSINT